MTALLKIAAMLVLPSTFMIGFSVWADSIEIEPVYLEDKPCYQVIILVQQPAQ